MSTATTLVFGATGARGGAVIDELRARDETVVAVARTDDAAEQLRRSGLDVVVGDLGTATIPPEATSIHVPLPAAIDAAGFVTNATTIADRLAGTDAHVVIGMPSIVPAATTGVAVPDSRLAATEVIRERVPRATIVTTTMLLENFSQALRPAVAQGALPYPIPADVPVAWVAGRDLADVIAACLLASDVAGETIHLGGAEPLTGPELCEVISAATGDTVEYVPIDEATFAGAMSPFLGDTVAGAIAQMTAWAGTGGTRFLVPDADAVDAYMRLPRTSVTRWADDAFATA